MIVTSFTLRSPCSWKLQCEMYVLQFYLNLFSVVLAQLRVTLHCRCIDASTSTPPRLSTFTCSHAHIRRSTSPPHHTHTSAHLYHICTSTLSLLHICPVLLSFYISFLSSLCIYIFARSHPQIYLSTSIHLQIYIAPAHHTVTPSHPPSLSLSIHLSTVLDNYMSRSRTNRRLVFWPRLFFFTQHTMEFRIRNFTNSPKVRRASACVSQGRVLGGKVCYTHNKPFRNHNNNRFSPTR